MHPGQVRANGDIITSQAVGRCVDEQRHMLCTQWKVRTMRTPENVIYTDNGYGPVSKLAGTACTIGIQSFISNASFDNGTCKLELDWPLQSALNHKDIVPAKEGGKRKILVALGGGTFDTPSWQACSDNLDAFADALVSFVKTNDFDGIDIDWEDTGALTKSGGYDAVAFLSGLTRKLRAGLPAPQYIITHAPQPPYFDASFHGGTYMQVMKQVGTLIDYLNIQYYNNGDFVGTTGSEQAEKVAGTTGSPAFATSIVGLVAQGLPVEKLLVGKPTTPHNAGTGFLPVDEFCSDVVAPLVAKYGANFGGVMGWQLAQSPSSADLEYDWISTVADALSGNAE
ncbi:chitinase [Thalassospira marina]|uniref:chitinase n=2 Tax=Thalassospira marina TaxID=2048283 RepID=A0ABM6Q4V8_9PROT|nr:chitinase [Thalassospira marina]